MTPKERAAMQQALEALEVSTDWDVGAKGKQLQSMKAITALRGALSEQAEQEPVAYVSEIYQSRYTLEWNGRSLPVGTKLYAAPVRTVDLTDDELIALWESSKECISFKEYEDCARAVIAADREKNK